MELKMAFSVYKIDPWTISIQKAPHKLQNALKGEGVCLLF